MWSSFLLFFAAIVLVVNTEILQTEDDGELQDGLLVQINGVERKMEQRMERFKESFGTRLDQMEAKFETLISRVSNGGRLGTSLPSSFPTKVRGRTEELKLLFSDIQAKIDNLTASLNLNQGASSADLNDFKTSVQHELRIYRTQLDDIVRQLKTDKTAESELLNQQVQALQLTVQGMERNARVKRRREAVPKIQAAFSDGNLTVASKYINEMDDDLDGAMPEVIKGLYESNVTRFDGMLNLFHFLTSKQRQAGIASLVHAMNESSQVDSVEFVRLAALAQREFGSELKQRFPVVLQNVIWSKNLCVQSRVGGYLAVDTTRVIGGYEVKTNKPADPNSKSGFCRWKFSSAVQPVSHSIAFLPDLIVERNLNLNVQDNQVFAKAIKRWARYYDHGPNLNWEISSSRNGLGLVIKTLSTPAAFLCESPGSAKIKRVMLSNVFSVNCEWEVDKLDLD